MSDSNNESISQGDMVRLKSGGPLMTVDAVRGKLVECCWFDKKQRCEDDFGIHLLDKVDPAPKVSITGPLA